MYRKGEPQTDNFHFFCIAGSEDGDRSTASVDNDFQKQNKKQSTKKKTKLNDKCNVNSSDEKCRKKQTEENKEKGNAVRKHSCNSEEE